MGARVICRNEKKSKLDEYEFENFGGHINGDYQGLPYMTVAVVIGTSRSEIDEFLSLFCKIYDKMLND